jgi:crotonobetainyl-CoA:carnitine CoA-transferase CaiB-like acyl-CoA transferase
VSTAGDVVSDAHLAARGYFADHGPAPLSGGAVSACPRRRAPRPARAAVGEHNDEVYRGELGLSAGDCARARATGSDLTA